MDKEQNYQGEYYQENKERLKSIRDIPYNKEKKRIYAENYRKEKKRLYDREYNRTRRKSRKEKVVVKYVEKIILPTRDLMKEKNIDYKKSYLALKDLAINFMIKKINMIQFVEGMYEIDWLIEEEIKTTKQEIREEKVFT